MSEYPVQIGKVQAPPLRDETLERTRLLDWLHVKIHRRAVLVLAEAGYGKTTLLADFSRRSRVRALWYRLDRGDRDWVGFLSYLVASVRIHLPDFAPVTLSMLRETGGTLPPRDTVLDTFIRELGDLPPDPTALVLDDVHAVDDSADVRTILHELVARAPERLTFVLISRKIPPIPLARLRALGEVAELRTPELRFDASETEQLFRETYSLALEPSVVAELSRRTEGWAASLQLVRTAIRDRSASEIRAFVNSLNGAEGDLYDYLAEEVVGELSPELQQFLMRTSLLDVVEPVLAAVAAETSADATRSAIADGELIGLFSRIGPQARDRVRAHPLVRDFLSARLVRSSGMDTVIAIHRAVAVAAEEIDWRIAGHHYVAAGSLDDARRVLGTAIETILATGAYAAAATLASALPPRAEVDPNVLVVRSRIAQQQGLAEEGLEIAEEAFAVNSESSAVVLTLITARLLVGDVAGGVGLVDQLESLGGNTSVPLMARAIRAMIECSVAGDLSSAASELEALIVELRRRSEKHFLGVALTDIAYIRNAEGGAESALSSASEAVGLLEETSAGVELVSAYLARAWALALGGDLEAARLEVEHARAVAPAGRAAEIVYEAGEIEVMLGDANRAAEMLLGLEGAAPDTDVGEQVTLLRILLNLVLGRVDEARRMLPDLSHNAPRSSVSFEAKRLYVEALSLWMSGDVGADVRAQSARSLATAQHSRVLAGASRLLSDAANEGPLEQSIVSVVATDPPALSIAAEVVCPALGDISARALGLVRAEAERRPERWRQPLRQALDLPHPATQYEAARILEAIGTIEDVPRLRSAARLLHDRPGSAALGRALARRLAARVHIADLGRVRLEIGDRAVDGASVRRKVLALLCYLITRPGQGATREEVLEALWPDLPPSTALNSLNQTVYFLRRVFEPSFSEDLTAGYVGQDGETVWLDRDLITSASQRCRDSIRSMTPVPSPDGVLMLARDYVGRFALDFMYDEWASSYRDSLHAAYLRVIEMALRLDADSGHYARGIEIAQLATDVEPDSDELQIALLRLYRMAGSHAAAAEQYGHYAQALHELGVEPRPLASL